MEKKAHSVRDLTDSVDSNSEMSGNNEVDNYAKRCNKESNWHCRLWLQSNDNNEDTGFISAPSSNIILHLCHVCKSNCQTNYRNDISKHFVSRRRISTVKSKSSAIIWYRYFARYWINVGFLDCVLHRLRFF